MEISFSPQLLHQQQQQEGSHNNYMMTNILIIFLTSIAFVANSFKKQYAKEAEQPHGDDEESSDDSYCSVCLSQFCKGEKLRILPICNHRYHSDCIAAWLKNHTTCPLCRNNIIDHHVSDNSNQHKFLHVKQFKESMIGVLLGFSDLLVGVVYMMLPTTIRETFPLVH